MKTFMWHNKTVVLLSVIIVLTAFFSEQVGPVLQYQRQSILDGQIYRLLTAHLVHTNIYHALLNLAGLILVWALACRYIAQHEWWLALCLSAVMVSVGLILFNPDIQWYRGLSGILHALLVVAVLRARQLPILVRGVILLTLVVKVAFEQNQNGFWQSEQLIGAPVIADAHLYGLLGGVISYLIIRRFKSDKLFGD